LQGCKIKHFDKPRNNIMQYETVLQNWKPN